MNETIWQPKTWADGSAAAVSFSLCQKFQYSSCYFDRSFFPRAAPLPGVALVVPRADMWMASSDLKSLISRFC